MNALAVDPSGQVAEPSQDALWRLAYAITGDRSTARAVVAEVLARLPAGTTTAARRYREVAALARARNRAATPHAPADPDHRLSHHDPLWQALRPLPRRQRAQIVQRLSQIERSASTG